MSISGLAALDEEQPHPTWVVPERTRHAEAVLNESVLDIVEADQDSSGQTNSKRSMGELLTDLWNALSLWLPGEIVVGYAAALTLMNLQSPSNAQGVWLWIIALLAAPALVWALSWSKRTRRTTREAKRRFVWKVVLSAPAFALWSASVPSSIWTQLQWFRDSSAIFLFVLFVITLIFTAIAERLTGVKPKKVRNPKPKPKQESDLQPKVK